MELREALEVLGPYRVRLGMRAIDDRRDLSQYGWCATCFVGEAFGGTKEGYCAAINARTVGGELILYLNEENTAHAAARSVEQYYENWNHNGQRNQLRAECIAFLAEHGTAPEKRPYVKPELIPEPSLLEVTLVSGCDRPDWCPKERI